MLRHPRRGQDKTREMFPPAFLSLPVRPHPAQMFHGLTRRRLGGPASHNGVARFWMTGKGDDLGALRQHGRAEVTQWPDTHRVNPKMFRPRFRPELHAGANIRSDVVLLELVLA